MVLTLLFVLGLIVGSFLNVIIFRYQSDKFLFSKKLLGGRSHCPQCKKNLNWHELVPLLSFLIQLGKCRSCGKKISWQYPIVELLTGLVFLLPIYFYYYLQIPLHLAFGDLLVWYYWFSGAWVSAGVLMIILSVIDWRTFLIPDETVLGIAFLGIFIAALKNFYQEFFGWQVSFLNNYADLVNLSSNFYNHIFWEHILAGVIGFIFFGLIFLLTKGRGMGFGDVKLAGALGLLLGWPDVFLSFGIAFVIGSLVGLLMISLGQKKFREPIPFGPYLVLSVFIVVLFGHQILDYYFKLFGIF